MPKVHKIISLQYFCNISRNVKDETDFLPADNRQRFLQNDTIILGVCVTKNTHITQNKKFAIFYNISIKTLVMKLNCSMHISMKVSYKLVCDFDGDGQPKVLKITSLQCLYSISKNKLEIKLFFCMQITSNFPASWFQYFRFRFPLRW